MRHIFWRYVTILGVFLLLLLSPLTIEAQPGDNEIPVLLSTGLPTTDTPEEILPQGAVVYLRANSILRLMEDIDSLLTSFVPEKALPPEFQPFLNDPQPFIGFLGQQLFGQPVALKEIPNLIGLALDRPVSLAFYPMDPLQGFVLSVPIAHPMVAAGIVQEILRPRNVEKGEIGDVTYYHIVTSGRDLPRDMYMVVSETTAFFCGSLELVQMLVNSSNMGAISADPVIANGIKKYENRDVALMLSPAFIKPQLPLLQQQLVQFLIPAFQQIRQVVDNIPPAERLMIDARLRMEFGINNLDQLVDYAEAYASGISNILLDRLVRLLTNLDGIALALDVEETFQNTALTFFSQDILPGNMAHTLPLDAITQALSMLPGDKSTLIALGKTPATHSSQLVTDILAAIEEELTRRALPTGVFFTLKDYFLARQHISPLTSKVDWTLKTMLPTIEEIDFSQFTTLWELPKYVFDRLSGAPLVFSLTLMPLVTDGLIEEHFTEKASAFSQNGQFYREMRAKLPIKQPFFDSSSQFYQEEVGENLKKLIFENIHTTRRGFFGYQQHELINRQIMFHKTLEGYDIVYDAGADPTYIKNLLDTETHPVPAAAVELINLAPEGTHLLSLFRTLHLISNLLDILDGVEDLIHRELDSFLMKVQAIVDTSGEEEIEMKLLEAGLDLPLLMMSLHVDEEGQVYCTLPGGLYYPRPSILPKVKELFKDFLAKSSDIGGSASFIATQQGALEISSLQSTEAFALLTKTVLNNFFDTYMTSLEGMELLQNTLMHPADFQDRSEEQIFMNPLWEVLMEGGGEVSFLGGTQTPQQAQTANEIKALATAIESYMIDMGFYPKHAELIAMQNSDALQDYYNGTYVDAWGWPIFYLSDADGHSYLLISYGEDGFPGYTDDAADEDIIFMYGWFLSPLFAEFDTTFELNEALIMAVKGNAADIVQAVLILGADPNTTDVEGQEALSLANELGHDDIVELLREFGATDFAK